MRIITNFYEGKWQTRGSSDVLSVQNPATGEKIAEASISGPAEVDAAVQSAALAFREWRGVPVTDRVQPLFRLKAMLEEHLEELSRTITLECGKTLAEARGELRRAIENVEVAAGMPILIQGAFSENIARGIDEFSIRQPLGVCAVIARSIFRL